MEVQSLEQKAKIIVMEKIIKLTEKYEFRYLDSIQDPTYNYEEKNNDGISR